MMPLRGLTKSANGAVVLRWEPPVPGHNNREMQV